MITSLIVAMDLNMLIGAENKLIWHIPEDLKHFKNITLNKPIIMGRKTYESIGRPLPKRRNVVISRTIESIEGCEVVKSLEDAIILVDGVEECIVIGGGSIYKEALDKNLIDRMYITIINNMFSVNGSSVYFPNAIWEKDWNTELIRKYTADVDDPTDYNMFFYKYDKK